MSPFSRDAHFDAWQPNPTTDTIASSLTRLEKKNTITLAYTRELRSKPYGKANHDTWARGSGPWGRSLGLAPAGSSPQGASGPSGAGKPEDMIREE